MAIQIQEIFKTGLDMCGSDIFVIPGSPISLKRGGEIFPITSERVMPDSSKELLEQIYQLANRDIKRLLEEGDDAYSPGSDGPLSPEEWHDFGYRPGGKRKNYDFSLSD